jgi:hypothetical protein
MKQPLVIAYGLGVDSTAAIVQLVQLGYIIDLILFADTGNEKQETYDYLPIFNKWLRRMRQPQVTVVRNVVQDFKHWPPYKSLGENCLTNGTLPSLAFGFKSCSLKWKVAPQNKFCDAWQPAIDWWYGEGKTTQRPCGKGFMTVPLASRKVRKVIGYDASPKDQKRFAHSQGLEDPLYDYWYPLIDWGWDRDECKRQIALAGLPVPPKSACYFCPATQPEELHEFRKVYLRYIVIMEARAEPRLEVIEGLWRNGTKGTRGGKKKPGKMTTYIREHGLLPAEEIDDLVSRAPTEILDNQQAFATGAEIPEWHDFIEAFTPEDALGDTGAGSHRLPMLGGCNGCTAC